MDDYVDYWAKLVLRLAVRRGPPILNWPGAAERRPIRLDTEANSESKRVKTGAHVDMRIAGRDAARGGSANTRGNRQRNVLGKTAEVGVAVFDAQPDIARIHPLRTAADGVAHARVAPASGSATRGWADAGYGRVKQSGGHGPNIAAYPNDPLTCPNATPPVQ